MICQLGTFGSSIGHRVGFGRDQFLSYVNESIDLGDTVAGALDQWIEQKLPIPKGAEFRGDGTRQELERISSETGIVLAVGVVEKVGATLFCSTVLVDPRDGIVAKRRKVQPTATERLCWAQGSTNTLKATTLNIQGVSVTIGTAICWENFMPLLRYSLYSQNVNIYLAPTADARETWLPLMQTIASEGRTFVLSCNQVVRESQLPAWADSEQQHTPTKPTSFKREQNPIPPLRRASTTFKTIEEGLEICLPENQEQTVIIKNGPTKNPYTRRKSSVIRADNGIEVCLPVVEQDTPVNGHTKEHQNHPRDTDGASEPTGTWNSHDKLESSIISSSDEGETDELPQSTSSDFVCRGGSSIVSPFGTVLAGPSFEKEGLLISDIDLDDCIRGKLDFDVAGHYSRSDAFKLTVEGLDLSQP